MAASKKFIPGIWRHPTSSEDKYVPLDSDSRLTVRAEDGLAFLLDDSREGYDIIVVDASDPVGPGAALYSDEFYASLRRRLKPKGAVAVQVRAKMCRQQLQTRPNESWPRVLSGNQRRLCRQRDAPKVSSIGV